MFPDYESRTFLPAREGRSMHGRCCSCCSCFFLFWPALKNSKKCVKKVLNRCAFKKNLTLCASTWKHTSFDVLAFARGDFAAVNLGDWVIITCTSAVTREYIMSRDESDSYFWLPEKKTGTYSFFLERDLVKNVSPDITVFCRHSSIYYVTKRENNTHPSTVKNGENIPPSQLFPRKFGRKRFSGHLLILLAPYFFHRKTTFSGHFIFKRFFRII